MHISINEKVIVSRRLDYYRKSIESEEPPSGDYIEELYEEIGVVFSDAALRSFTKARDFYSQVVADRKHFLNQEIEALENRIVSLREKIKELTKKRSDLLQILREHGALNEMVKLQERHVIRVQRLEEVKKQIERRRQMESDMRQISRNKTDLADLTANDHKDRQDTWKIPVGLFNSNSQALYRVPGHQVIDTTDSGFQFRIEISKSGSEGVNKMKIFCFDLAVLESCVRRDLSIDFLIHDSEMFDGVDSRQRAAALELAHKVAKRTGTQYICALNSDMVPHDDFRSGFTLDEFVRCRLTDGDVSGTLLGIRFEPPAQS